MDKLYSYQVKLGILSNVKRRILLGKNKTAKIEASKDLGGIFYTDVDTKDNEEIGKDVLHPDMEFSIINPYEAVSRPTIGISETSDLNSLRQLLEFYGLYEFSREDLLKFANEIILNKKWLKEFQKQYGIVFKKYGPIIINYYNPTNDYLDSSLASLILKTSQKGLFLENKKHK